MVLAPLPVWMMIPPESFHDGLLNGTESDFLPGRYSGTRLTTGAAACTDPADDTFHHCCLLSSDDEIYLVAGPSFLVLFQFEDTSMEPLTSCPCLALNGVFKHLPTLWCHNLGIILK